MSRSFQGTVVLITGSSRGIGRETATLFAEHGATVVLNGRDKSRLEETAGRLRSAGYDVSSEAADVTDAEQCRRMIDSILSRHGRLDILVNNAGVSMRGAFCELTSRVIESVSTINLVGAALPTRCAVQAITESRGSIVFISSLAGVRGFAGVSIYSASKMALTGLAESLHAELSPAGVHVGVLFPAFTENDPDKTVMGTDGSPIQITRTASTTQRQVAQAVLDLVARRRRKVYLTAAGKCLVFMQRHFPRLTDAVILRSRGRIHRSRS
jgi:dehydrogenase/reductase SDR family member 7B